jgi:hypothetical protein
MMEEWDLNPRNGVHPKTSKEGKMFFFFWAEHGDVSVN